MLESTESLVGGEQEQGEESDGGLQCLRRQSRTSEGVETFCGLWGCRQRGHHRAAGREDSPGGEVDQVKDGLEMILCFTFFHYNIRKLILLDYFLELD